jgi:predicted ATPase
LSTLSQALVLPLEFFNSFLWSLGYPDQARKRSLEALALAQELSHPHSLAAALDSASLVHQSRQEWQTAQEQAESMIALSREQGFAFFLAIGAIRLGRALVEQGQHEEGITQTRRGWAAVQATGAESPRPYVLSQLAEAYGKVGRTGEGLALLAEALNAVNKTDARWGEAELHRLKGELTLQQSRASLGQVQDKSQASQNKSEVPNTQHPTPSTQVEAETCFLKAIAIAQKQQAKSWELRTATSLARLWQSQGKSQAARELLAPIYGWFTEGFDTKDLKEAKTLLEELAEN